MSANEKVVELGPHNKMTPEEALAYSSRESWDQVIIVGFHKDDDDFVVQSSHMSREFALWIAEHLKLHVMDRL
ncbi:hypothetical protein C8D77_111101 [Mesorhizobium loti]|uniref:Uncharacterized protein n=1 Tax=Rhizobium loti TaxID=381 RepID=A0A8E2WAK4_RHILI|nr:hypothetical protein [Mesorhizobium loti]PWJ88378.1 hypothetical protein C8D77_111101 [Mesorhizobium loti]